VVSLRCAAASERAARSSAARTCVGDSSQRRTVAATRHLPVPRSESFPRDVRHTDRRKQSGVVRFNHSPAMSPPRDTPRSHSA